MFVALLTCTPEPGKTVAPRGDGPRRVFSGPVPMMRAMPARKPAHALTRLLALPAALFVM